MPGPEMPQGQVPMSPDVMEHAQLQAALQPGLVERVEHVGAVVFDGAMTAIDSVARVLRLAPEAPAMVSSHAPNRARYTDELYPVLIDPRG